MATLVTALMDIERESKGDHRPFNSYLQWAKATVNIPCHMVVFAQPKIAAQIRKFRTVQGDYKFLVIEQELKELYFYSFLNQITRILESAEFKKRMKDTNRIECYLPLYLIINYSKFKWLEQAMSINPGNSNQFFWIDIGLSRFFTPSEFALPFEPKEIIEDKLYIQYTNTWHHKVLHHGYWDNTSTVFGGFFGGTKTGVRSAMKAVYELFHHMLKQKVMNNEQIALQILARTQPELFKIVLPTKRTCSMYLLLQGRDEQKIVYREETKTETKSLSWYNTSNCTTCTSSANVVYILLAVLMILPFVAFVIWLIAYQHKTSKVD